MGPQGSAGLRVSRSIMQGVELVAAEDGLDDAFGKWRRA
jgi:hypothetical protein